MSESALDLPAEVRAAIDGAHRALNDLVVGSADSSRDVYRHSDGITLFGAYGGYETGWPTIARRLDAIGPLVSGGGDSGSVTVTTLAARASGDLACTVELERHSRPANADPDHHEGADTRTLRVTQVYTRVDGDWKLVHRHADPLSDVQAELTETGWAQVTEAQG